MPVAVHPSLRVLLTGLAAGDSLGATSEFRGASEMPTLVEKHAETTGWPFWQAGGGPFGWRVGQPTDDTDMAMALVIAHVHQRRDFPEDPRPFDPVKVVEQFLAWMRTAPSDMGSTTRRALSALGSGTPWSRGGKAIWESNRHAWANGSLMRNGVIAGMVDDLDSGFRASLQHGMMTHYAPLPQLCCAAQTYLLWRLLHLDAPIVGLRHAAFFSSWLADFHDAFAVYLDRETDPAVAEWVATTKADHQEAWDTLFAAQWGPHFDPWQYDGLMGKQGFCLLTLQIAVWALYHASVTKLETPGTPQFWNPELAQYGYPRRLFYRGGPWVLSWVALIGGDTDTYGATAGPLIAALFAYSPLVRPGLPTELRDGLEAVAAFDRLVS